MLRPPSDTDRSVDALLRDLGPQLRRGGQPAQPGARFPTGIADFDRLLGGGFPRGRLSEVAGPPSSGRTSLTLALLAGITRAGEVGALVDRADAFDPESAEAAGVHLDRLLWVRAPGLRQALRSTERLLAAGGFALVVLDLTDPGLQVAPAAWPRLARASAAAHAALVVLSNRRAVGTCAEVAIELKSTRAHFTGTPPLLECLEIEAVLVRHRSAPAPRTTSVRLRTRVAA